MSTIFISHASADKTLALMIKELLLQAFGVVRPRLTVFCSSDVADVEGGKKWFDQIVANLKKSRICVALMTPQSVYYSPWVAYEAGGAYVRFEANSKRSRLFPVCAYGMTADNLPAPLKELQVRSSARRGDLQVLCREIGNCLGAGGSVKLQPRLVREVVIEAAKGSSHWESVTLALVGQQYGSSPFGVESLLMRASSHIFCAGFNLNHIATSNTLKKEFFEFLDGSPRRSARFLISDPAKRKEFAAWRVVAESFLKDLHESIRHFKEWTAEARRRGLQNRFEVRRAPFVALSITCIDPDSSEAQLVLVPTIVGKPLKAERPHVLLSRRRQPEVFSYYWETYRELFRRSPPIGTRRA